ncbi:MAG TPA: glycine cleavage system protein H [Anaeromyxobacter sp.]|nr:glycine cleavage system protein H [Anaeromyxobacter sp.]
MTTVIEILEAVGAFLVGLAGRFGVFLVAGLALLLPALVAAAIWRAIDRRRRPADELTLDARISPNHTWLEPRRRGTVTVGVDEIASAILPSATAVDLPRAGMVVHKGDPIAVIHAGRRAVRIPAPADGVVARVNGRLRRNPALVKEQPYRSGWLFEVAPDDEEWRKLPAGLRADTFILSERRRLARFVEEELGLAAADGGDLVAPAPALLGEEGWRRVVAAFLHAA